MRFQVTHRKVLEHFMPKFVLVFHSLQPLQHAQHYLCFNMPFAGATTALPALMVDRRPWL